MQIPPFIIYIWYFVISPVLLLKNDYRYISYRDLQSSITTFSYEEITPYSEILFDISRNQVIVGVKDGMYRLSLSKLLLLEEAKWQPSDEKKSACINKGQSEENCHNYIKVLQSNGNELFACGTNAFSPQCSWREIENISAVTKFVDGIAKCPYNPMANVTAILSEGSNYFFGGSTDFSGSDSLISRSITNNKVIRTKQYNNFWLNEPQFVGSFENEKFVYFLFREAAVEYMNCGKAIYSRIARICKNDQGGGHSMFRDNWTTFIKTRLNCSISGDYPFYFNEIQSMTYVSYENLVYATFTTPPNSMPGSAVCVFNLTAINEAFSGPFKHQHHMNSAWMKYDNLYGSHFDCTSFNRTNLIQTSQYQLMDSAVQAATLNPIHLGVGERFSHITVDILDTRHGIIHVIYVATLDGSIKKLTLLPNNKKACITEIWQATPNKNTPIRNMQFLKETNSVYVTTNKAIMQIGAAQCKRHSSRNNCKNAMDPYCGWNERDETCSMAPDGDFYKVFWNQSVTSCPILDAPVDGGWSNWSEWAQCQVSYQKFSKTSCFCQTRHCNNPPPASNGKPCEGTSVAVTNCTIDGGWSDWSGWSPCSATCGVAVKTRFRTCTNPAPAFGGRTCVGQERNEAICAESPQCPALPMDGGWGLWSPWTPCSVVCGGGFRLRHRKCDSPAPLNGGQCCKGNGTEYERCGEEPCSEIIKVQTTELITSGNLAHNKRKYKIICKAPVKQSGQIRISIKEQSCDDDHECRDKENEWNPWSSWSQCTASCGIGFQTRTRSCKFCTGDAVEKRTCNNNGCEDVWDDWTEWSPCSATCGKGYRERHRRCLRDKCLGSSRDVQICENQKCEEMLLEQPSSCVSVGLSFFFIGAIVGLMPSLIYLIYYLLRKKKNVIPSSPHYMTAEQNPYILVPPREKITNKKHNCSSNAYLANGTVKSMKYVADYEIPTTLKRNSHEVRNNHSEQSDKFLYD